MNLDKLFKHLADEHGLLLLESEKREISDCLPKLRKKEHDSSFILGELSEKIKGMRQFVVQHYNQMSAVGALTVIDELESWLKNQS
jgi:hypothetical protein